MKTILITGLDGSGKSTVFEKLKQGASPQTGFLHVPYFQTDCIPENFEYLELCREINEMGSHADEWKLPLLKIYALFGSMMLFSRVEKAFKQSGKMLLFAERHPLIDTSLYAQVYLPYMNPEKFPSGLFARMDAHFGKALRQILGLTGPEESTHSFAKALLERIYSTFGKNTPTLADLSTFFDCQLPDQIYFLDAPAAVLIERIGDRNTKEYHEEEEKLDFLRNAYLRSLKSIENVEIIPAERFETLDLFTEKLKEKSKRI